MKTQNYWHSLEEKTDLLKSYLEAIDVKEVNNLLVNVQAVLVDPKENASTKVQGIRFNVACRRYWLNGV